MDGSFGLGSVMARLIGDGVINLLLLQVLFQRMLAKLLVLVHAPGIDDSCTGTVFSRIRMLDWVARLNLNPHFTETEVLDVAKSCIGTNR